MKIFLTRRAERNYGSIKDYIKQEWGDKTAGEFAQKTDDFFNLLKIYPSMGQIEKDDTRGFQLSPHTRTRDRSSWFYSSEIFAVLPDSKQSLYLSKESVLMSVVLSNFN